MVVDPGHQVCAVLFAAVPPPDQGQFVYLYDELYINECDAGMFAAQVQGKVAHDTFQSFIMDAHMGIHTEMGVGRTVAQQYTEALRVLNVRSLTTGSGFLFGSDDVLAGISAVKMLFRIREDGTPKLRVLKDKLPNFEWEIKRYHRKKMQGVITDMPNQRKNNHLMDGLRYLAMANPQYVAQKGHKPPPSGAYKAFLDKKQKMRQAEGGVGTIRLGPGNSIR
jgi:hypothetical protein